MRAFFYLLNTHHRGTEAQRKPFCCFCRSGFSREHQLIVFTNIWFCSCLSELRCRSHPCDLPLLHPSMGFALRASLWLFKFDPVKFVGSASQHKFIPDEFVLARTKNVTQKMRPVRFINIGNSRRVRRAHHGSATGLLFAYR